MIEILCGNCGRRGAAKDDWAGRKVRCPGCGAAIVVTGEPNAPAAGLPQPPRQATATRSAPGNSRPAAAERPNPAPAARPDAGQEPSTSPAARTSPHSVVSRAVSPVRPRQPSSARPQSQRDTTQEQEIVEAAEVVDSLPVAGGIDDLLSGALTDSGFGTSALSGTPLTAALGPAAPRSRAKKKSSNTILWIVLGGVGALAIIAVVIAVLVPQSGIGLP